MAAVNQGAGGGVSEWISNIPFVTRYYFLGALGMTLAGNFGLIPSYYLVWSFDFFLQKFHIWRAFTAFLFMGGLGFPFLMNMSFLYRYSGLLERTYFGSNSADYIYMLLLCSLALLIPGTLMGLSVLGLGLILSVVYVWSRINPHQEMSFMFGLKFQAVYFPWVLCAFNLLMGGMPILQLLGIFVGHIYYFLKEIYPRSPGGWDILATPAWLVNILPASAAQTGYRVFAPNPNAAAGGGGGGGAGAGGFAMPGQAAAPAGGGNYWGNLGGGNRLGRE